MAYPALSSVLFLELPHQPRPPRRLRSNGDPKSEGRATIHDLRIERRYMRAAIGCVDTSVRPRGSSQSCVRACAAGGVDPGELRALSLHVVATNAHLTSRDEATLCADGDAVAHVVRCVVQHGHTSNNVYQLPRTGGIAHTAELRRDERIAAPDAPGASTTTSVTKSKTRSRRTETTDEKSK